MDTNSSVHFAIVATSRQRVASCRRRHERGTALLAARRRLRGNAPRIDAGFVIWRPQREPNALGYLSNGDKRLPEQAGGQGGDGGDRRVPASAAAGAAHTFPD